MHLKVLSAKREPLHSGPNDCFFAEVCDCNGKVGFDRYIKEVDHVNVLCCCMCSYLMFPSNMHRELIHICLWCLPECLQICLNANNFVWPGDGGGRPSSVMSLGMASVGSHSHGHPASPIGVGSLWEDIDPRSPEPLVVRGGWLWLIWVVRWTT